jgi:phosphoribosylamine--glycine ligase
MSTVLVVGSGGREHALSYGLNASEQVDKLYVVPGNAGTASLSKAENAQVEHSELAAFCKDMQVDFVVIGPDAAIVAGLGDQLRSRGISTFAPSQAAAALEGSKGFATEFMQRHGISLPPSQVVYDKAAAKAAVVAFGGPAVSVIKADGLAAGKGVFLPDTDEEASDAIDKIFAGEVDGRGAQAVIQQRYHGPEVSMFVLSDGMTHKIIPIPCQDHKRLLEADKGPNTGGMGVYAPLPKWLLSDDQLAKISTIADQTFAGMLAESTPYESVLYLGIMLAEELGGDPIVIEYNARWGDPETEVLVPLLMHCGVDIYEMLHATATGALASYELPATITGTAITTCLAVPGYPDKPVTGQVIHGLKKQYSDVVVFQAGTKHTDQGLITNGGRVIFVTGLGDNLADAQVAANQAIGESAIHFDDMQLRRDIGYQALTPAS